MLDLLRRYRDHAIQEGRLPERFPLEGPTAEGGTEGETPPRPSPVAELEQAWTDFRATFQAQVPTEDEDLSILLAWGLKTANDELDGAARVTVRTRDGSSLELTSGSEGHRLLVALCNKSSRGGHLGRQMAEALQSAKGHVPVLVRTTEFPASTGTVVAEQFLRLQKKGGAGWCSEMEICATCWRCAPSSRSPTTRAP
ncbi:hypothetical protein ACN28S_27355 [Cystobacter fuscus]